MQLDGVLEDLIASVETTTVDRLSKDNRFQDSRKLIDAFRHHTARWHEGGQASVVVNVINELAAADALLKLDASASITLKYESRLANTKKSIDFLVVFPDGSQSWIDVKTISPKWDDSESAWQRFLQIAENFPENSSLVMHRDWCGAALSGDEIKARWSLVQRTLEVEEKASLLDRSENGPVRLLVCSNGSVHVDALEDFADFYQMKRFRIDDWASNAISQYMRERDLTFSRALAGFCFLERRWDEPSASEFKIDVRGPMDGR